VIKLTQQTGMATGVGVRMLFDDNIATFDQYVTTKSEAAANQTLDIPFQVRYQQISNEVTPGLPIPLLLSLWLISNHYEKNHTFRCNGRDGAGICR
jgi:hypothetical protein